MYEKFEYSSSREVLSLSSDSKTTILHDMYTYTRDFVFVSEYAKSASWDVPFAGENCAWRGLFTLR